MGDGDTKTEEVEKVKKGRLAETVSATSEAMNTKGGRKLTDAVAGLVGIPRAITDSFVDPKRRLAISKAKAEGRVIAAQADAEIERLRIETGEFVRDREMRKTENRRAILVEARKALPVSDEDVSDEPISEDFTHTFFDEFDSISDPEVHKIAGRLLAGEIARPGSFPRRTMRVLKDLESSEFKLFASLCRFSGSLGPLVFNLDDAIYKEQGLSFVKLTELERLGLISFSNISSYGYPLTQEGDLKDVQYAGNTMTIKLKKEAGRFVVGKVMLTDVGRRLQPLTSAKIIPEFLPYLIKKWQSDGHEISLNGVVQEGEKK